MWVVNATPPGPISNNGWDFKPKFFPRKVHDKKQAKELADEARRKGGTGVTFSKVK